MSNKEYVRRVCGDTDVVPYVPMEEVNEVGDQEEVEEPARINLNVFWFVRSTLSEGDIARLYLAYRIDPNMYRLSVIPPPVLMTHLILLSPLLILWLVSIFLWIHPSLIFFILNLVNSILMLPGQFLY